jgi:hypothetical protein
VHVVVLARQKREHHRSDRCRSFRLAAHRLNVSLASGESTRQFSRVRYLDSSRTP